MLCYVCCLHTGCLLGKAMRTARPPKLGDPFDAGKGQANGSLGYEVLRPMICVFLMVGHVQQAA